MTQLTSTVSRRSLLAASTAGGVLASASGGAHGAPPVGSEEDPILKPLPRRRFVDLGTNAETRWDSVRPADHLTDPRRLFVRNHTWTPRIDARRWRLRVHGDGVRRSTRFSLDDLQALPRETVTAALECTGNGRSFFDTQQGEPADGTAWTLGAVGAVRFEGVRLAEVLDRAGIRRSAVDVLATGLDEPYESDGVRYGRVRRPFPVAKALDDALLAWGMNGRPLLPDHGFPLRLVLPGWVGIANIKWLGSLRVARRELASPWSTKWYRMTGGAFPSASEPLTLNPVRSAWELPWEARLPAGRRRTLTGRSWSGAGRIRAVDVSLDGGASWQPAQVTRRSDAWTQWATTWVDPQPGRHEVLARATDVRGRTQPDVAAWNDGGYFFDAVVRHPVVVGA